MVVVSTTRGRGGTLRSAVTVIGSHVGTDPKFRILRTSSSGPRRRKRLPERFRAIKHRRLEPFQKRLRVHVNTYLYTRPVAGRARVFIFAKRRREKPRGVRAHTYHPRNIAGLPFLYYYYCVFSPPPHPSHLSSPLFFTHSIIPSQTRQVFIRYT